MFVFKFKLAVDSDVAFFAFSHSFVYNSANGSFNLAFSHAVRRDVNLGEFGVLNPFAVVTKPPYTEKRLNSGARI